MLSEVLKLIGYFLLDEESVRMVAKQAKKNLHIDLLRKAEDLRLSAASMRVYLSTFSYFLTDYDSELQELAVQWSINNFAYILSPDSQMHIPD